MAVYLYLGKYTSEGLAGLVKEGGSSREAETRGFFERLGGRVLQYGFTTGPYDFVVLAELPDAVAGLVPSLTVGSTGTASVQTLKLIPPQRLDEAAAKARQTNFRPAGS